MGVDQGGNLIETSEIVWKNFDMQISSPLKLVQGEVDCATKNLCQIQTNALVKGEIYTLVFYSYSFMVYNGTQNYYLFGSSLPNVSPVYKHLFFVRGWNVEPMENFTVSFEQSYLEFKGSNLLYQNQTRIRGIMLSNVVQANFTTKAINISFYISKSVICSVKKRPHATVLQRDIHDDKFIVRDLNFQGCQSGQVFANIYLWRGIKNPQSGIFSNLFVTNYLDYYVGTFGCHSDCLRCNGTSNSTCLLCRDSMKKYLYQGQCLDFCPTEAPYFESYSINFNSSWVSGKQCQRQCGESKFPFHRLQPLYNAIPCIQCFPDCQICSHDSPNSCDRCIPIRFNYRGTCLSTCPDNDLSSISQLDQYLIPNYDNYTCVESRNSKSLNQTALINVTFVPMGFRKRIPKDQILFFRAVVQNLRGNITQVLWKQIDPIYNFSDYINGDKVYWTKPEIKNKFIFDDVTGMDAKTKYLPTKYAFKKLRMSSFNYFKDTDAFRFIVRAENTKGEYNIDLMEVGINDPPKAKDLFIKISDKYFNLTMRTLVSISTINETIKTGQKGWFDVQQDQQQELSFKLYIDTADKRFLIFPSTYRKETFNFMIPFISNTYDYALVDLYVVAQDKYASTVYKNIKLKVTNNYDPDKTRFAVLTDFKNILQNGSLSQPYYQLMISNFFEVAFENPRLLVTSGQFCISDYHCFNHGQCVTNRQGGSGRCQCNQGYVGEYCQVTNDELVLAQILTEQTINMIPKYFQYHVDIELYLNTDLEYLVFVIRGFLKSFETFDSFIPLTNAMRYVKITIDSHFEVVNTFTRAFYDDYYEVMSRIMGLIHFQRMKIVDLEGMGLEVELKMKSLQELNKLTQYCFDEFSRKLIIKMNKQSFFDYFFTNSYLTLHLYRLYAQEILNNTRSNKDTLFKIDDVAPLGTNVHVKAPPSFLNNNPNVNEVNELRVKFVSYQVSPYMVEDPDLDQMIDSPVVKFEIMNALGEDIKVDIANQVNQTSKYIEIVFPYQDSKKLAQESLRCKSLDKELNYFTSKGCGLQIYDQNNCINCSFPAKKVAVCYCDHLSTDFALIFDQGPGTDSFKLQSLSTVSTTEELGTMPKLGIYTDFYGMLFWNQSMGFIAVIGVMSLYLVGLFVVIIFDVQPQKRLKYKLTRDFRSMDKYLYDPDELTVSSSNTLVTNEDNSQIFNNSTVVALKPKKSILKKRVQISTPNDEPKDLHYEGGDKEVGPSQSSSTMQNFHNQSQQLHQIDEQQRPNTSQSSSSTTQRRITQPSQLGLTTQARRVKETKNNKSQLSFQPQDPLQDTVDIPMTTSKIEINEGLQQEIPSQIQEQQNEEIKEEQTELSQPVAEQQKSQQIITEEELSNTEQKLIIPIEEEEKEDKDNDRLSQASPVFDLKKEKEFTNTKNFPEFPRDKNKKLPFELELDKIEKMNDFTEIDVKSKKTSFFDNIMKINFFKKKEVDETILQSKVDVEPPPTDTSYLSPRSKKIQEQEQKKKENRRRKILKLKQQEVQRLKDEKEVEIYTLWNMIKYGNPLFNLLCVDSILFPRHSRWTLLIEEIMLIWFLCGVIYNNTQSPLDVPDFSKKAARLAAQDIWISLIAPVGVMFMMYLFTALFRISDTRMKYAPELASLKAMLKELKKEMMIRFLMAYFVAFALFGAISYYIIQFTSQFGWKVSWAWWYSGCGAAVMNFLVYDILISTINWILYRVYQPLGIFIGEVRFIKQAREEC